MGKLSSTFGNRMRIEILYSYFFVACTRLLKYRVRRSGNKSRDMKSSNNSTPESVIKECNHALESQDNEQHPGHVSNGSHYGLSFTQRALLRT